MKMFCYLTVSLLFLCIAACSQQPASKPWREALALTDGLEVRKCVVATKVEAEQIELAARALEYDDPNKTFGSMRIGAAKTLGSDIWSKVNGVSYPVCLDKSIYDRIGLALARQGGLGKHRIVEYELLLALKISDPPQVLVDDVARVAFSEVPWQSEIFVYEDIRPLARAVLASYRIRASKYGDLASKQMNSDSALGTGAAQIAVATNQLGSLEKTMQMMDSLIRSFPPQQTIPWNVRNRFYELAWALTYSTEKTSERVAAIEKIMSRKVQSNATTFGMVDLSPKKMCTVMAKISPEFDLKKYSYCFSDDPYEQ
jgi:hypothetical protein